MVQNRWILWGMCLSIPRQAFGSLADGGLVVDTCGVGTAGGLWTKLLKHEGPQNLCMDDEPCGLPAAIELANLLSIAPVTRDTFPNTTGRTQSTEQCDGVLR